MNRRSFISKAAATAAGFTFVAFPENTFSAIPDNRMFFKISLAEWSLNKKLFSGEMNNLDFPAYSKKKFGINAVEFVNQFFPSAASSYINDLKNRCNSENVTSILIMVDGEGDLGELYGPKRMRAVERHYPWVEAAKTLDCHSIRVNARGNGSEEDVAKAAVDGLSKLSEFAQDFNINVIVENHGGYSSNGKWLSDVIRETGMSNCGTLPDFGNFRISQDKVYDRYKGVRELMPFAKGVSAKSNDFTANGAEKFTDFTKMLSIVKESGYEGYIGIEYEGWNLSEDDGILATKQLLLKAGASV